MGGSGAGPPTSIQECLVCARSEFDLDVRLLEICDIENLPVVAVANFDAGALTSRQRGLHG